MLRNEYSIFVYLSGPTAKDFWVDPPQMGSFFDEVHHEDRGKGKFRRVHKLTPLFENFVKNYNEVMDGLKQFECMRDHFKQSVMELVEDYTAGLLALLPFFLLTFLPPYA